VPATPKLRREISGRLFEASLRHDVTLSSVVTSESDWSGGPIHWMLIHSEVERDGCEIEA